MSAARAEKKPPASEPRSRARLHLTGFVSVAVLAFTAVLWSAFQGSDGADAESQKGVRTSPPEQRPSVTPATTSSKPPAHLAGEQARPDDDIALMGAGSTDNSDEEPRHPHPITPTHERNFRQINLVNAIDGAVDARDFDAIRRMNSEYRAQYPEARVFHEGYDLIADCQERRTEQTRATAERYWNTEVASNLRRYVRRHCLD